MTMDVEYSLNIVQILPPFAGNGDVNNYDWIGEASFFVCTCDISNYRIKHFFLYTGIN